MALHRPVTIAGAITALLAGLLLGVPAAEAAPEDYQGRLLLEGGTFAPGQPDTRELQTVSPAGAERSTFMPLGAGHQFYTADHLDWSPDGTRVVFAGRPQAAGAGALPDIWVMNPDATDPVQLTDYAGYDFSPSWSPDGSTIAFLRQDPESGPADVWLMDADGTDQRLLTQWSIPNSGPDSMEWHPSEGTLLLGGNQTVYTLDVDAPSPAVLYASGGTDMGWPQWSPDGSSIAVSVEITTPETGSQADVVLVDPDDGSALNLTNTPNMHEYVGGWSPDGLALAWTEMTRFFVMRGVFVHELGSGTTTQVVTVDPNVESWTVRDWIPDATEPPVDPDDVDTEVDPGDTVSTDPEGDGATAEDPVETAVTSPNAGTVTVDERPLSAAPPANYEFLGQEVAITAPSATAADPLVLAFRVDASLVPDGTAPGDLVPFRNGTAVPDCTGARRDREPRPLSGLRRARDRRRRHPDRADVGGQPLELRREHGPARHHAADHHDHRAAQQRDVRTGPGGDGRLRLRRHRLRRDPVPGHPRGRGAAEHGEPRVDDVPGQRRGRGGQHRDPGGDVPRGQPAGRDAQRHLRDPRLRRLVDCPVRLPQPELVPRLAPGRHPQRVHDGTG